jgi:phosphopantetheine adenylyltransferase
MSHDEHSKLNLDNLGKRLAVAEAKRVLLEKRRDELMREVGLAKGRLNRKPDVDKFLEELQAEAHQKRVGDFERLLSALVAEVLPGEPQVGLELDIERGQPSLDIVSRRGGDLTEDIYDDQGGALTNVVSMGLRMIAAVRSGTRRFMIMDEGDCWIATSQVPTFYRVLKDAATKVGVQCLAISHHDVSTFGESIAVARLSGDKDTGAQIENAPRRHKWADDEDGIRWVRLKNFQTFVDETIYLSPGVNALEGRNNLGKSALVRAFRAVFYGESRDALIRHGEKLCTVEISFSGGRTLHWNRQAGRNPINIWKLLGPDGAVVQEEGMVYETGGRTPPDWVADLFGIKKVEGLDVHINTQKSPVFLLNKPGSTRAAVLSIGQESGHIRSMIALHKERCVNDSACVKNGESEMSGIVDTLEKLKSLEELNRNYQLAKGLAKQIEATTARLGGMAEYVVRIEAANKELARANAIRDCLSAMPSDAALEKIVSRHEETARMEASIDEIEAAQARLLRCQRIADVLSMSGKIESSPRIEELEARIFGNIELETMVNNVVEAQTKLERCKRIASVFEQLPDAPPVLKRSDDKIIAGRAIRDAMKLLERSKRIAVVLAAIPEEPKLRSTSEMEKVVQHVETAQTARLALIEDRKNIDTEWAECESETAELLEKMGHACPVCGNHIDSAEVLLGSHEGHAHG